MQDEQLLLQIAQGQEDAFNVLYDRYNVLLYSYLCRLMQNEIAAQDILQDVFVTIWRDSRRFRSEASPKSWIFRIAHHQAVSWIRRQKRAVQWDVHDVWDGNKYLEEQALEWQAAEELYLALNELSAEQRAVVELTYSYEMSQQEIAMVLGCPVGTVKSRMNMALNRLGGILKRVEKKIV